MKKLAILIIIILFIIFIVIQSKIIYDRINFDFTKGFRGIDTSNFNITDLLSGQTEINPTLGMDIINDNGFSIPFKDLKATFYFDDTIIAETSEDLAKKHFTVPAHGKLTATDTVRLFLNKGGLNILKLKVTGQHPTLRYTVKVKLGLFNLIWIPIAYEDSFKW